MALPNAFRPRVPEPDSSHTTPAAPPVQNKTAERASDRPVSSTGSDTGKDKFKAILQKKSGQELTDGITDPVDDTTAEEASDSTTSPFDLAASARVPKGKGKVSPFSDVGMMHPTGTGEEDLLTSAADMSKTAAAKSSPSFVKTDAATVINEGEEAASALSSKNALDSALEAEDAKNLQLFTREDVLKAFASWENKKNSTHAQGIAIGAQSDASQAQAQAQIAGIAQINAPTQKSGGDEHINAQKAHETRIQLVDQLVKALSQLTQTDRTETTLTLKYPPIFEGVSITITEFKTAQKEFNVTFFNLTDPTARLLIETKQNQESLRNALIEKGYTLQMITIEPKLDISTATSNTAQDSKRQDQPNKENKQEKHSQGGKDDY